MRIITRHQNESIIVNHQISICIATLQKDRVRLAMRCPANYAIYREELWTVEVEKFQLGLFRPRIAHGPGQLALTRQPHEKILITAESDPQNVLVTIEPISIRHGRIAIKIDAPAEWSVLRQEEIPTF